MAPTPGERLASDVAAAHLSDRKEVDIDPDDRDADALPAALEEASPGRPAFAFNAKTVHRILLLVALAGLIAGSALAISGRPATANLAWAAATIPAISIAVDLWSGRMGVDAIAFVSMSAALALGQPLAGIVVAIMYAGGNVLEHYAVGRAERDLKLLTDRAPRTAHRLLEGRVEAVAVAEVEPGNRLLLRAGDIVPVDGLLADVSTLIDEAAVTGEPLPVRRGPGETVRSGTVNAGETVTMIAAARASDSTYAGIVRMVSSAQAAKVPFVRMADRFALVLLPVTLGVAGLAWYVSGDPVRALAVLVVATPCPLILAAPVAFISGVSRAARRGILVKGGGALEALARVRVAIFDKTGTLTVGGARLVGIETAPGEDADDILRLVASLEQASHHVLAATLIAAAHARSLPLSVPHDVGEIRGSGLEGIVEGKRVAAGSQALIAGETQLADWAARAIRRARWRSALTIFVAIDGRLAAAILLGDEVRTETAGALRWLRALGISRLMMVTGDHTAAAEAVAEGLDLDETKANCTPRQKIEVVREEAIRHPGMMIGDGINDAPALAAATVGIAMGARGASASSEAADVVILVENLNRVPESIAIARRTRQIALQSIVAGLALSGVAMVFAAAGLLPPVAGALTQEAIDVAVIINALRALGSGSRRRTVAMPASTARTIAAEHTAIHQTLDRLQTLSDSLDVAANGEAPGLVSQASEMIDREILDHERHDDRVLYPGLLGDHEYGALITALGYAHSEIFKLARVLRQIAADLAASEPDRLQVRDAQRVIDTIVLLVRLHTRQEDAICEQD